MQWKNEWVRGVPKESGANERFRLELLATAASDPTLQRDLIRACREDILFYINAFVFTFDPRTKDKSLPFVSYPYQDRGFMRILQCIEDQRDLVIEKSRDMGASWMCLMVMEWLWHFHYDYSFLLVSRKEKLVDNPGDLDALFPKIDFVHRYLPKWLLPKRYERTKLHFGNVATGSIIDGETTTAASGVGGRRTAMFIDEFSRIEEDYQLLAGTADTTNCRIFNFTVFGKGNAAYKLTKNPVIRKLRLFWAEHPEKARGLYQYDLKKNKLDIRDTSYVYGPDYHFIQDGKLRSAWYDAEQKRRNNDREMAMMIDIDYEGSSYQFFSKELILDLQESYTCPPYWEGDIAFDPLTGRPDPDHPFRKEANGPLKLWIQPDAKMHIPRSDYGAGCDLATGSGATNSVCSIIDGKTGEKVAEYASPYLRPEQMASRVTALCWMFKGEFQDCARLCWEQQGPGHMFGRKVIELGYRHVYYRVPENSLTKKPSDTPGWYPTADTKTVLLQEYRDALSERRVVNRSWIALEECLAFEHTEHGVEYNDSESNIDPLTGEMDPTGSKINHGDRVIADALAWKMVSGEGKMKKKSEEEVKEGSLQWRRDYSRRLLEESAAW